MGVILCILAFPVGSKSSRGTLPLSRMEAENVTASAPGSQDAAAYEQKLEKRVREILRGVSGAVSYTHLDVYKRQMKQTRS